MELIDLVNFVTIFLSQTTFLRCLTFPTRIPDRNSHSPTLLAYFVLLMLVCSTMAFPPLGNFDPVVVSVSIPSDFTAKLKQCQIFKSSFKKKKNKLFGTLSVIYDGAFLFIFEKWKRDFGSIEITWISICRF